MPLPRRTFLAAGAALPLAAGLTSPAAASRPSARGTTTRTTPSGTTGAGATGAGTAAADSAAALTNLAHLDWLGAEVEPPAQASHTTYRLADQPAVGVLWTYADRQADGTYQRIGGGTYDPATVTVPEWPG